MERADDIFSQQSMRAYRLNIFTQLRQATGTMHRPEELFQWLASVIMQSFDVAIVQFWTCEVGWLDQPSARLRAMACQDSSRPAYMVSEKVAMTVEQISKGQRILLPQPLEQVFPQYLASLLKRYGLSYCCYCLIDRNVRFASGEYTLSQRPSTGLTFIALLFLRNYPRQDLISTVNIILEQALVVAENRHLLLPVTANPTRPSVPQEAVSQEPLTVLHNLIPHRKQDVSLLLSSNPFASSSVTISDKQARRLYEAIDNRKSVDELRSSVGMTMKEIQTALQTLLTLQYIEIYTAAGLPVDISRLFQNR